MYDRFSERARKIMKYAYQESLRLNHGKIDTEHILFGFLEEGSGVGANVIENLDVDLVRVRCALEQSMPPPCTEAGGPSLPYTPAAKRVLELAIEEAKGIEHNYVGSEHLLLGMLRESEGIAARVLFDAGLNLISVRQEILEFLGLQNSDAKQFENVDRVLQMAANEAARSGSALIEPEHLLAGLVVYLDFEQRWGIDFDVILRSLEKNLLPVSKSDNPAEPSNSADAYEVLRLALKNAVDLKASTVHPEHLLLGLLEFGHGPAFDALTRHNVTFNSFREKIRPRS